MDDEKKEDLIVLDECYSFFDNRFDGNDFFSPQLELSEKKDL